MLYRWKQLQTLLEAAGTKVSLQAKNHKLNFKSNISFALCVGMSLQAHGLRH